MVVTVNVAAVAELTPTTPAALMPDDFSWAGGCDRFTHAEVCDHKPAGRLQRAAKILEAIETLFDDVDTRGVAEADCPVVTEGGAGNDCDVRLAE